jgi:uncharacterized membrane protein YhaH (DUF805 family)
MTEMKETIAITILTIVFLLISYKFHFLLLRAKKARFFILSLSYIICTYFLFDISGYLHQYLRNKGIYFQFGHAEEMLVEIFFLWLLLCLINIILVLIRKRLRDALGRKSNSEN